MDFKCGIYFLVFVTHLIGVTLVVKLAGWICPCFSVYHYTGIIELGACFLIAVLTFRFSKQRYLDDKVHPDKKAVLITGCDSGFGHGLAKRLDSEGFRVFACCLKPSGEGATALQRNCSKKLQVLELDVTKDENVKKVLEHVKENLGKDVLWALVNNAGMTTGFSVDLSPIQAFRDCLEVNTIGPIRMVKAFLPLLRKSKGRIVNLTSIAGRQIFPFVTPYCMSKYAAVAFNDCLRIEMNFWGVKVISIEPDFFKTNLMNEEVILEDLEKTIDSTDDEQMATKWGIVSAGKISNDFVAAVKSLNDKEHEFVAVSARSLSSAESFASVHGIPKAYGSYEELAHDSDVEVVYIGIINSGHFSLGKLMLENRKHVLMEKPMTLNAQQTASLIEIATRNKRFLMEAIWSRFLPSYSCLMDLLRRGSIGDIVHVEANLGINMMYRERLVTKPLGGGTVLDLGIYPLNAVTMIYNGEKPLKIAAVGHLNEDGIDIGMTCSLQYSKNRTANITTSGIAELPCDMVITGTKGRIKIPNSIYAALTIETAGKIYSFPLPESGTTTNYPGSNGLKYEAIEVRKCIQNGMLESSIMPLKDSALLSRIMDEIHRQIDVVYPEETAS